MCIVCEGILFVDLVPRAKSIAQSETRVLLASPTAEMCSSRVAYLESLKVVCGGFHLDWKMITTKSLRRIIIYALE